MKQSPPRRPKGDERGAVLIQTLLILLILIPAVLGGYTIWKVGFVRQSLRSGTYQATRYLCLNPVDRSGRSTQAEWEDTWEEVVVEIVRREVENNGLAEDASDPVATVTIHGNELDRGLRFTVETQMGFPIGIPFFGLSIPLTLRDRYENCEVE
jgi:hypothetical protein